MATSKKASPKPAKPSAAKKPASKSTPRKKAAAKGQAPAAAIRTDVNPAGSWPFPVGKRPS